MGVWSALLGITGSKFGLGRAGPALKNNAGVVEARNNADSAYAVTRGADPVGSDDLVTLRYLNANPPAGAELVIGITIGTSGTYTSTAVIPANARVSRTAVLVTTAYSAGGTIAVGQTGSTSLLQATTDNLATSLGTYDTTDPIAWGGSALAVLVTIGGSPSTGVGLVLVYYTVPST